MTRSEVLEELNSYIEILARPLEEGDLQNGWNSNYQNRAISMMNGILEALRLKNPLPSGSIVRTMDSWGVEGRLFDQACAISHHLHIMTE